MPYEIDPIEMRPLDDKWNKTGSRHGAHNIWLDMTKDDLMYITWFNAGLRVVDWSNPFRPKEVGYYIPAGTKGALLPAEQRRAGGQGYRPHLHGRPLGAGPAHHGVHGLGLSWPGSLKNPACDPCKETKTPCSCRGGSRTPGRRRSLSGCGVLRGEGVFFLTPRSHHITLTLSSGGAAYRRVRPRSQVRPGLRALPRYGPSGLLGMRGSGFRSSFRRIRVCRRDRPPCLSLRKTTTGG